MFFKKFFIFYVATTLSVNLLGSGLRLDSNLKEPKPHKIWVLSEDATMTANNSAVLATFTIVNSILFGMLFCFEKAKIKSLANNNQAITISMALITAASWVASLLTIKNYFVINNS